MGRRRSLRLLVLLLLILPERRSVVTSAEPGGRRTRRLLVASMGGRSVVRGTGVAPVLSGVALRLVVARVEAAGLGHRGGRRVV